MNIDYKISYGLYVLSTKNGSKHNGCIINTLLQHTANPDMYSVTVNKANYSNKLLKQTGKCAVAILSTNTRFDMIQNFGFSSGKNRDKFDNISSVNTKNGFLIPSQNVIGYIELDIESTVDFPTHTQFIGKPTDKAIYSDNDALTYDFYQKNIKPKQSIKVNANEKVYVCNICGHIHRGEMPDDFICPICKHPRSDFRLVESSEELENITVEQKASEKEKTPENGQKKFICQVCGYVHLGDNPPDNCPVCGVDKDMFEEIK